MQNPTQQPNAITEHNAEHTSLFSTLEAMHGPESLMETSDADSSFVQYLRNIQLGPVESYDEGLHAALDSAHHWTI